MPDKVILGRDFLTDEAVYLRDSQRTDGLWILGKPGMGKTTPLLHLLQHDIQAGHGLFFFDPHWELTTELLRQIDRSVQDKILRFDPMDETHTFCINPLSCPDPTSLPQRTEAFTRTYSLLHHLLLEVPAKTPLFSEGLPKTPQVELLLVHAINVFLENQEYTLAELPLFLANREFREHLLQNVRFHSEAVRFWTDQFPEAEAPLIAARANHLFANPTVEQIIGNPEPTVNFPRFLAENKIVLVQFSKALALEHQACISALLLSELLAAVKHRYQQKKNRFSICVNELCEVPSLDDFLVLFANAKDFGITTTFAVHKLSERFWQTPQIRDTVTPAANIIFQLPDKDAWEFAPELIQNLSPPRPGWEDEQVITPTPVEHIWEQCSAAMGCMQNLRNISG